MDRDEAIRRAEIAMAWATGETVQHFISAESGYGWKDTYSPEQCNDGPAVFRSEIEWRIKPKPLECWAELDSTNTPTGYTAWGESPEVTGRNTRWVRMREVTNETDD